MSENKQPMDTECEICGEYFTKKGIWVHKARKHGTKDPQVKDVDSDSPSDFSFIMDALLGRDDVEVKFCHYDQQGNRVKLFIEYEVF